MKIKVNGDGVLSIAVYKKSYRFHRKIQPDQEVIENLILAKCDGDKFEYVDSAYNETMSTSVKSGEYICLFNVDYATAGVPVRKYAVTISGSVKFQIAHLDPDNDHSLLKCIMLPKIESLPKYKPRFDNKIVLFTGNRFEQTAIGFFYVKNQNDNLIHFKPTVYFKNIKSIEGEVPKGLKMNKDDRYLYLGNRIKAAQAFQTGGSGKTSETAISGEIEPRLIIAIKVEKITIITSPAVIPSGSFFFKRSAINFFPYITATKNVKFKKKIITAILPPNFNDLSLFNSWHLSI